MKINDPNLGLLDFDEGGVAEVALKLNGRTVDVTIWFEAGLPADHLAAVTLRMANLEALDAAARAVIASELRQGEEDAASVEYREHHLSELGADALGQLFGGASPLQISDCVFLSALRLLRVDVVPGSDAGEITLDYSLGDEFTNYVLVVGFDEAGEVMRVDMES